MLVRRDWIVRMGGPGWSGKTHLRHPCLESLPRPVTWLGHLCHHVQHHHAVLEDVYSVALSARVSNQQLCEVLVGCRRLHSRLFNRGYPRIIVPMQADGICLVSQSNSPTQVPSSDCYNIGVSTSLPSTASVPRSSTPPTPP